VQRASDACASEWLAIGVFSTQRHQTRHFVLGKLHFFAAKSGKGEIGNLVVESGIRTVNGESHVEHFLCGPGRRPDER